MSTTLALELSPSGVRPRAGYRAMLVLGGSWLVAALAQLEVHLGFTPVPATGQTLGVPATLLPTGWRPARNRD